MSLGYHTSSLSGFCFLYPDWCSWMHCHVLIPTHDTRRYTGSQNDRRQSCTTTSARVFQGVTLPPHTKISIWLPRRMHHRDLLMDAHLTKNAKWHPFRLNRHPTCVRISYHFETFYQKVFFPQSCNIVELHGVLISGVFSFMEFVCV